MAALRVAVLRGERGDDEDSRYGADGGQSCERGECGVRESRLVHGGVSSPELLRRLVVSCGGGERVRMTRS